MKTAGSRLYDSEKFTNDDGSAKLTCVLINTNDSINIWIDVMTCAKKTDNNPGVAGVFQ